MTFPARVSLITLGVADVARATRFYEALGWQGSSMSQESVTFFRTGGYSGYLTDLDGHLWEVAHNPFIPLRADGLLDLPE